MADQNVMAQMLMGQGGPPPPGGPPPGGPPPMGGAPGGPPPMPEAAPGAGQPMNPMQAKEFLNQLGISEAAIPVVAQAIQALMTSMPPNGGPPGAPPPQGMM